MEFEEIKEKIYPWIKRVYQKDEEPDNGNEIELSEEDTPVYQDWLGGLGIFYAVDEGTHFNLLLNRDIAEYQLSIDELHNIALENLERNVEFRFTETVFGGHGLIAGGDHEAAAICLDDIWHWCAGQLGDNLVVAVAAKDMILMVPISDASKIQELQHFVSELFEEGDRLLTQQLFLFDAENNSWSELE